MKVLRWLLRGSVWIVFALSAFALFYMLWSAWAYRDIASDTLVESYGDENIHYTEIGEQPLYYRLDGPELGSAPVVLLIHSHYFDSTLFDTWSEVLAHNFTVLRFDMTSHGLTGPDLYNDYTMTRSLELIDGLLEQLMVSELAIVGSSLGGNMAFHWAAQNPERATHLVLVNSGGLKREQNTRGSAAGIAAWFYRVFYFVPELAYRQFLRWMIVDDTLVNEDLVERFHAMFRREGNRFAEMERMRQFDVGDPDTALARVTAPTLILWGADNPQLPVALVDDFVARLTAAPRVERIVYPAVGHVLPLEAPELGAGDIRRFLLE
ncbi:MAG: pimeloyl-ACP methyl ester carboxylesterase [Bacteroidia bacterium]